MATSENNTVPTPGKNTVSGRDHPLVLPREMYKPRVFEDMKRLFENEELTDIMVAAGGQSIDCHKVLLASASEFFRRKFVTDPESMRHNLLEIENVDFPSLKAAVSFIYSGEIALTVDVAKTLVPASIVLMVPELTGACKDWLSDKMTRDPPEFSSAVAIYRIGKENCLQEVAEKAWSVMLDRFEDVSGTDGFKDLTETELQEYLHDEGLNVSNEDPVFEALVTWVQHNVEAREVSFDALMKNINLAHCSLRFLRDNVKNEQLMKTEESRAALSEAIFSLASLSALQWGTARKGYSDRTNTLLIVGDKGWELNEEDSTWNTEERYHIPRRMGHYSACLAWDGIILTGGWAGNKPMKQCWKLSLYSMRWTPLADLNVARSNHATVCVGNRVYVFGGYRENRFRVTPSAEFLNVETELWDVISDMPKPLCDHTAANIRDVVYVFGGGGTSKSSSETFSLDTNSREWSVNEKMPANCRNGSSVVYESRIYVVGGKENCCISYDPQLDQWATLAKPAMKHFGSSAVLWKGRIMLCGGRDSPRAEEYDPASDTWTPLEVEMPPKSNGLVFAVRK